MRRKYDVTKSSFEQWHAAICRAYACSTYIGLPDAGFHGDSYLRSFGRLFVGGVRTCGNSASDIKFDRTTVHISHDARDDYTLFCVTCGHMYFEQANRQAVASSGHFLLADHAEPWRFRASGNYGATTVIIPRPLLDARLLDIRDTLARPVATAFGLGRIASGYLTGMSELAAANATAGADTIASSALDVLATTFESQLGRLGAASRQNDKLEQIKSYLRRNLDNQDLTVEMIARQQGVTARTLNRLFARDGTTPIRWLWNQRLQSSYCALLEGRAASVTEAAYRSGFSDVSHFSRAFRKAYDVSPKSVLRRA